MARAMRLALLAFAMLVAGPARATVTSAYHPVTYTGNGGSTYAITFPFGSASWIKVTKTLISTGAAVVLTQGTQYSVTPGTGSGSGYITTTSIVSSLYTIKIELVIPATQTTSFRTQGTYSAAAHEAAFDKLTLLYQQCVAGSGTDGQTAVDTHVGQADPHTQYALLAGRSGGQTLIGGTASGNDLWIKSSSHATKGKIRAGSSGTELVVDDVNDRVGIGTATPAVTLDVVGAIAGTTTLTVPTIYGSASPSGDASIVSTSDATKGKIKLGSGGTELVVDDLNNRVGIGTAAPSVALDVSGSEKVSGSVTVGGSTGVIVENSLVWQKTDLNTSLFAGIADASGTVAGGNIAFYGPGATSAKYLSLRGDTIELLSADHLTQYGTVGSAGLAYGTGGSLVLTAGTFSGNTTAYVRSVWTKLSWTNAMLVACGAVATCDITVATLPAKTLVKRVLLVVTGAATYAAGTLTMSIGKTAGGGEYVIAGSIKAAANTVYGDADAEIGTALYSTAGDDHRTDDLPNFTGTTALNARIAAGAGTIDGVTTSTGYVLIETELLP